MHAQLWMIRFMAVLGIGAICVPAASAQTTAEYVVEFNATWSASSHPLNFPPNPHFSGLIGGTHSDQVTFWMEGVLASPGIKAMAETGSKTLLQNEVQAAINAGTASSVISGGGIGVSPGTVSKTFTIEDTYPLVTLVSMVAPSPDWFIGVSGVSLRENSEWLNEKIVELVVFDSGTDSGINYQSSNSPTIPPVPIFEKMDGPFASNNVVGQFIFTRTTVGVAEAEGVARPRLHLAPLGPNPIVQSSRFEIQVPAGTRTDLSVFDVTGRLIRTLLDGESPAGSKIVTWDARDARGGHVPAGIYFLRLSAGSQQRVEKLVVAR